MFGWSLPFEPGVLGPSLLALLQEAGLVDHEDGLLRSRVRVSRLEDRLFLHSAYPTERPDAVFLGPDSYRFARLIRAWLASAPAARTILDLGAGAGVGGLVAAALQPQARIILADVNPEALELARINAAFGGCEVETAVGDVGAHELDGVDLAVANPPFMLDRQRRAYRDGGAMHGAQLSLDWTVHTARRLAPGGRMILYSGSAIVDGRDHLREALEAALPALGCSLHYEEVDPDIFGDELDQPGYENVERIAAVGALIIRRA